MTKQTTSDKENPVLIVVDGTLRGQQWVVDSEQLIIGRGTECDIVVPERSISREHLRIWREGTQFYIEDLGSKNGTYLNGERLEEIRPLREGDEIQVAVAAKIKFIGSDATVPLMLDDLDGLSRGLRLDEHTRQVMINGQPLDPQLSLYQYRLLELLVSQDGGVCTRDDVVRIVWPDAVEEGVSEQAIDALVRRLRDRIAEIDPDHQYIVTVRGHGFRLEQPRP